MEFLYEFCGNETFWNDSLLQLDRPILTSCFLDTVPVWASCGYLWIASLPYILFLRFRGSHPLVTSCLHVIKTALCMAALCLTELFMTMRQMHGSTCRGIEQTPGSVHVAMWTKTATFLWAAGLLQIQKRCGMKTSGVTFTFWLLLAGSETLQLYAYVIDEVRCETQIVFYVYYSIVIGQLIVHCFAEREPHNKPTEKICAEDDASILNRLTFHWMTRLVFRTMKTSFDRDQVWDPPRSLQSAVVGPHLEKLWQKELAKHQHKPRLQQAPMPTDLSISASTEDTPLLTKEELRTERTNDKDGARASLVRVLVRAYWFDVLEFTMYSMIAVGAFYIVPPLLNNLIAFIDNKSTGAQPLWQGLFYALAMFVVMTVCSLGYHVNVNHSSKFGFRLKSALMFLIYKKALTVSKAENQVAVGDVVNLMSVDCQRIMESVYYSYYILISVVLVAMATWELYIVVGGFATLGAMLLIAITIPINSYIAKVQSYLQKELLYLKGLRVRLLNEMFSGMKVLKMYAWEPVFIQKVNAIREKEVAKLHHNAILMAVTSAIANHSTFMIHFVLIVIFTFTTPGMYLSSSAVFVSLSVILVIKYPIVLMPTVINGLVQAYVSLSRIESFLCCTDIDDANVLFVKNADYTVHVRDASFLWDPRDSEPILSSINMKIKTGQLIAVVGQSGSGKSSLISSLLGEMSKLSGSVQIKGNMAYVPQDAWIQNMTLRDNILFGRDFNSSRYWKVIDNCCLKSDLAMLAGGDKTEIGEKGTNISGGQKQRISLARAVYNNADVYLMDDPLSAVDAHVGKDLFKNVIGNSGQLKNKTRILVTHAMHWLPLVDNIIVMNQGTISELGTYDELMTHNGPFAQFLLQYLTTESAADDMDDPEIQWIRNNMREQVESVTTSDGGGGASSDNRGSRLSGGRRLKKKKLRRRSDAALSSQSAKTASTAVPMATDYEVKRLITEETVQEGSVKLSVYWKYVQSMGVFWAVLSLVTMVIYQGLSMYSMFWLTYWTEDPYLKNRTNTGSDQYSDKVTYYLTWFTVMGVLQGVAVFYTFYLALTKLIRASSLLHSRMLLRVLRSPMAFFDTVPIGRILNRFSSDVDIMDNKMPESFRVWINMMFSMLASVIVMGISTPIFIVVMLPMAIIVITLLYLYLPSTRKMRRIESVTRSPTYNHFSETLSGSCVIRAYKCGDRFVDEATKRIDNNCRFYHAAMSGTRWASVRLELLGNILVVAAVIFIIVSDTINGAQLGLSVSYAIQISFALNTLVWSVAEMEMNAVSAERVHEYTELSSEAEWMRGKKRAPSEWPRAGTIVYKSYSTRYRPGLDLVLKDVSFTIRHGEKIGVVGRTGAGKSSMTLSLFRIVESAGGAIYIDGVNIADLGLHTLRSKFAILPQDPVLFSGTLRMNVDPVGCHSDEDIWRALESAHLKTLVTKQDQGLEYDCGESGQNFSVGQRQLVCLARTMLNKTKILILDEATANVDMATDDLIQNTIRSQFNDCTIITVAHRLNTIMDYDRVMVLDKGAIREFAPPRELLKDKYGVFYSMAKDARLI